MVSGGMNYFPLVASRESSDRSNNIEPSADTDFDQNNSFEGTVQEELDQRSKDYVPTRPPSSKKNDIDSFSDCLQSIAKSFVEKDPTDTILKFLSEEKERYTRHEMQMLQLLIQIQNRPAFFTLHPDGFCHTTNIKLSAW